MTWSRIDVVVVLAALGVLGIAAIAFASHRYRCRLCGDQFDTVDAFDRHLKNFHRYE